MIDSTSKRILHALYCLSRDTCAIDATELARAAGTSATEAARALIALERAGLVDATRARLTMLGLARAVRAAGSSGAPRVDLRRARPRRRATPPPMAADPAVVPTPLDRLDCAAAPAGDPRAC